MLKYVETKEMPATIDLILGESSNELRFSRSIPLSSITGEVVRRSANGSR